MLQGELNRQPLRWAITSHAIRRRHSPGAPHRVTQAWLSAVWRYERLPSPQEQADTFIQYLGEAEVAPGAWVQCNPQHLTGPLGTADNPTRGETSGFVYVVDHIKAKGLVEQESHPDPRSPGTVGYRLTFDGWGRFEEFRRSLPDTRIAFMAMGYNNPDVDRAFSAFVGAVAQTGFELPRLDQKPKAGLIDLRMRVEIRTAKFLVADLTDENRGAYWEAGFAEGLGKNVYCTCEASKLDAAKTHFDTEHLLTVKWNADNMSPALDKLKSAIRNDFLMDAIQVDGTTG
ncbi:MAG TPA: hypothetical protein VJ770_18730 [Stellaceae bacterium]|nr:hypothetical protein [Stellaceae bacterium]